MAMTGLRHPAASTVALPRFLIFFSSRLISCGVIAVMRIDGKHFFDMEPTA